MIGKIGCLISPVVLQRKKKQIIFQHTTTKTNYELFWGLIFIMSRPTQNWHTSKTMEINIVHIEFDYAYVWKCLKVKVTAGTISEEINYMGKEWSF